MAEQPVASVWNEIRIADDGISVTLYSEDADGVRVEGERRFTFDELEEMDGDMDSIRLSDETYNRMGRDTMSLAEVRESLKREGVRKRFEAGETVIDGNPPSWSDDNRLEVQGYADEQADEYVVREIESGEDRTVADVNPSFDPDEPVVKAVYAGGVNNNTYAFPQARLEKLSDET